MTFKTLTLTSPILLDHIRINSREYKPLQKYSFFHGDSKKRKTT